MPQDDSIAVTSDAIAWYDHNADEAVAFYEAASPDKVNDWLRGYLPSQQGLILDVGAGSGRDAA